MKITKATDEQIKSLDFKAMQWNELKSDDYRLLRSLIAELQEYRKGDQQKFAALAAENAALKCIQTWAVADVFKSGAKQFESTKAAGFDTDDCLHDAVLVMLSELKTPATDAFQAELRAQGVEMAAQSEQFSTWVQQGLRSFAIGVRLGDEFVSELCKGVQS